jgi:DNA-directed RNA polymerase subunit K
MAEVKYTKYEKARIIGARALQLSQGAPILIKLSEKDLEKIGYNTLEIAKKEFEEGLVPITVKRGNDHGKD